MQGLIKVLKDEERLQLALFYAAQPVPPAKADAARRPRARMCSPCAHAVMASRRAATIFTLAWPGRTWRICKPPITHYRDGTGIRSNQLMAIATAPSRTAMSSQILALSRPAPLTKYGVCVTVLMQIMALVFLNG